MKESLKILQTLPAQAGRLLAGGPVREAARELALCAGLLGLGVLLAGGSVAGRSMPFAVCLIAASGTALRALAALLGGAVGCLFFWGFTGGLEQLAVSVLVFAAVCVAGSAELGDAPWLMPLLAAVMHLLVGLLFLLRVRFAPPAVFWFLTRLAVVAGGSRIFARALARRSEGCALLLFLCCLSGCAGLRLAAGVTVGQIAAIAAAAAAAGTPSGLLLCAAAGLAVDIAAAPAVGLTAPLALAGAVCAGLGVRWRVLRAAAVLASVTACVLFTGGVMPELILSASLGVCIGALLPPSWLRRFEGRGEAAVRQRLERASDTLLQIHDLLDCGPASRSGWETAMIFDRASDRVCSCCVLWSQCWQHRSTETYRALCSAARPMLARGAAARTDFPEAFSEKCRHLDGLITAINREMDNMACRRQYQSRLQESRAVLAGQYAFLGRYLRRAAERLEQKRPPPAGFAPELGVGAAGRLGNAISGDRGACFRTPEGMYYLLLCDGMGAGAEAAAESGGAIRTLTSLLMAGAEPGEALQTLNGLYILRGDGGFSTVDLLAASLITGEATLYKWGAAPSYLKTAAETQKIGTAAPPPGFGVGEAHKAEEYRLSLREGETLVLLSDGAGGEEAGRQIAAWKDGAPRALAAALVAQGASDGSDDRTALALRLRPCN